MTADLPVLAVLQESGGATIFEIAAAARGLCRLLWLVDLAHPAIAAQHRALSRFGTVVDIAGRSAADVSPELADHQVRGVAVLTDPVIPYAAALAAELGLPFHSPETAVLLTDKAAQRRRLAERGVPSAGFVVVLRGAAVPDRVALPAVVKPRRGAGARGVVYAADHAAVAAALLAADEDMVVEEFLADLIPPQRQTTRADVLSVELAVVDGDVRPVGVTQRWPFAPPFRETGSFVPASLPAPDEDAIVTTAVAAAHALDVRTGFLHVEIKHTPTGPRVIEVNGRLGGLVADYHRRAGGGDLLRAAFLIALGRALEPLPELTQVAFLLWLYAPEGLTHVTSVVGVHEAREIPGVEDVRLHLRPGARVDASLGNDSYVVAVEGGAPDHETAFAVRAAVLDRIAIR